jgi:pimeloyl-ACP methyl ester carboxylesterase
MTIFETQSTRYLDRPEGMVAYEVMGDGPLVVLLPGMGDLRATYRFRAPAVAAAGYRVASTDLRGHGDSEATFTSYGDIETAGDVTALIEELGGAAVVVGNSTGAGAAVFAAATRPEIVRGLVLIGPVVRNGKTSPMQAGDAPRRDGTYVGGACLEVVCAEAVYGGTPDRPRGLLRRGRR